MSGQQLLPIEETMTTEIVTVETDRQPMGGALADLRSRAMSVDVQTMQVALVEYSERRKAFRDWLKSHMVEGVHYGYPPGCEPKYDEKTGSLKVWNNKKQGYDLIDEKQWKPKHSLYKAGAEFVIDLLGARPEYTADMDTWTQLGGLPNISCQICRLYSKATGEILGEGRGVSKVGAKGADENNAVKMAQKKAKVDAALTTWGLSDLFTQDVEDGPAPPPHDNPAAKADAPKTAPRGQRVSAEQVAELVSSWRSYRRDCDATFDKWQAWVEVVTCRTPFDVKSSKNWRPEDVQQVRTAIQREIESG